MDKSQLYIDMCKKAYEIQTLWHPKKGDWYALSNGEIKICIEDESPRNLTRNQLEISHEDKNVISIIKRIWLPKQDQLIEMSQMPGLRFNRNTLIFLDWANKKGPDRTTPNKKRFDTLEKARLNYLMEFKYKKIWNNSQWYSINNNPA